MTGRLTQTEFARLGGNRVKELYGRQHFVEMSRRRKVRKGWPKGVKRRRWNEQEIPMVQGPPDYIEGGDVD